MSLLSLFSSSSSLISRIVMATGIAFFSISCQESPTISENSASEEVNNDDIYYYRLGQDISVIAQAELLKNVKSALEEGGPSHAIEFCNIHATPLTDSISESYNCQISRVTLKTRNPKNLARGKNEILLLNNYLESSMDGQKIKDSLIENEKEYIFYRPIMLGMEACLKCHGQVEKDISSETMATIHELYPYDLAVDYVMGEFRGAWKIRFEKNID